jgi:predicted RNA-binding Zn-ribbon protein involved in translation (DUF1610 family)
MESASSKYIRNEFNMFVCPHCGITEKHQNTMLYHIESKHEMKHRFECTRCYDTPKFLQKCTYLHHLATVHPDDPHPNEKETNMYAGMKFRCPEPECMHSTHTKANLRIHFARTHAKSWIPSYVKGKTCTGCSKHFASSSAYLYHSTECFKASASSEHLTMLAQIQLEKTAMVA